MKSLLKFRFRSKIINFILMLLIPPAALCLVEFYTHVPWDLKVPVFLINLLFYYLLDLFFSFVTGSFAAGYAAGTFFAGAAGFLNYCVLQFRDAPVVPWDIYSIGTAVSVADNYHLETDPKLIKVLLGFAVLILAGSRIGLKTGGKTVRSSLIRRAAGALAALCLIVICGRAVGSDTVIRAAGFDTTLFTPKVLYRNNGFAGAFIGNLRYLFVDRPDGYSARGVEETAQKYRSEGITDTNDELPNVIVLMDEAFADMSVFGDFETDAPVMPFIDSLTENTVKGTAYVSVKGGNTANSEYEFLTGDSMLFMPEGSVPYQQYIKSDMRSMAADLKDMGYKTYALHPYNAKGWCRNKVYPYLGFEEMYFKDAFVAPEKIRSYISDYSAFSKIIELYEQKDKDSRMFAFEVTMQNHGGYSKDVDGFWERIHLTDLESKTTSVRAAEKYLTLIKETDSAFEGIVNYFSVQDEKTIIILFGDHQPSDYITNVFLRLQGIEREGNEEVLFQNYSVPYVIWANYDIDTDKFAQTDTSLNFLGGRLLDYAGISLSGYQKYLNELSESYPVITSVMTESADGTKKKASAADSELIGEYNRIVYNHLCDKEHYPEDFY